MEPRILELLHHPEKITKEDIYLLKKDISRYPYMQSIRTLHLSAIHLFDEVNYQKELTKTAAFTTDKKILYQFINKKAIEEKREAVKLKKIQFRTEQQQSVINDIVKSETPSDITDELPQKEVEPVLENYISETIHKEKPKMLQPEAIEEDLSIELDTPSSNMLQEESTNEQRNDEDTTQELNQNLEEVLPFEIEEDAEDEVGFKTRAEDLNFSKETILEHIDRKLDEATTSVKPSEISFNAFDSFLPGVKFSAPKGLEPVVAPIVSEIREEKTSYKAEVLEPLNTMPEEHMPVAVVQEVIEEEVQDLAWKPMSFMQNPLDSEINKVDKIFSKPIEQQLTEDFSGDVKEWSEEVSQEFETLIEASENITPVEEVPAVDWEEERPVYSVSFFSEEVSSIPQQEEPMGFTNHDLPLQSNVPDFVNTWQSWLKIDRKEPVQKGKEPVQTEKIIERKAEIIDRFIEDNPKISQLKEEVNFVIKDKADDISHLMTETLAKLYVEQRLYTKAVKAYEVLQEKHPEKKNQYDEEIKKIKDLRSNR